MKDFILLLTSVLFLSACSGSGDSKELKENLDRAIDEYYSPSNNFHTLLEGKKYVNIVNCKHEYEGGYRLLLVSVDEDELNAPENKNFAGEYSFEAEDIYIADILVFGGGYSSKNLGFSKGRIYSTESGVFDARIELGYSHMIDISRRESRVFYETDEDEDYIPEKEDFEISCAK